MSGGLGKTTGLFITPPFRPSSSQTTRYGRHLFYASHWRSRDSAFSARVTLFAGEASFFVWVYVVPRSAFGRGHERSWIPWVACGVRSCIVHCSGSYHVVPLSTYHLSRGENRTLSTSTL